MSSEKSRNIDGVGHVLNFINDDTLETIYQLSAGVKESLNPQRMANEGHANLYDAIRLETMAAGKFIEDFYKIVLNWSTFHPGFFVRRQDNHEPEIHADNETLDGKPKPGCEDFDVSGVLYFRSKFEGGELDFVHKNIKIKPKAGSLIFFPGDARYAHCVHGITSGVRLSSAMWFSILD
jgi:predicted 2-oxoglutarate/Fe(II)-dependent dioxygenase YbiX